MRQLFLVVPACANDEFVFRNCSGLALDVLLVLSRTML